MRRFGLALGVLAALGAASAPLTAQAQSPAPAQAQGKPDKTIKKDQQAKGLKEAPAVIQSAGVPCTVTDGYFLGESDQKTDAGKAYKSNIYEVACKEGMGYIVLAGSGDQKAKTYDCLSVADSASLACRLPGNADPKQGLIPLVAAAGEACTISNANYLGSSKSGQTVYEVACQDKDGFILQTTVGAAPTAEPCLQALGTPLACKLTTKAQSLAPIAKLVAQSGKTCQVSDGRFVGASAGSGPGVRFYEVACGAQPGFMIQTDSKDVFKQAINCGAASGIGGGCKMTDSTQAATQEASTYTGLAKAAGFDCNVSKYRFIGMQETPKAEVVELACSNRPDGTVAVFPDQAGAHARFVDCVRSAQFGSTGACQLTVPTSIYAKYSAALAARGRSSCKVSGARYLGQSAQSTDFIETSCTDGNPGWVIEFTATDNVKTLLSCGQAKASGLACTLPTNTKS